MKKTVFLLAVLMTLSATTFFGCKKKEEAPPAPTPGAEQAAPAAPEQAAPPAEQPPAAPEQEKPAAP